jgi:hypothetical protein
VSFHSTKTTGLSLKATAIANGFARPFETGLTAPLPANYAPAITPPPALIAFMHTVVVNR